jgi:hypothetical protein
LSSFQLYSHAKFYRSQEKDYIMPMVELQDFLNDLVTDSPHLGQAFSSRGGRQIQKRPLDNPKVVATKRQERDEGFG